MASDSPIPTKSPALEALFDRPDQGHRKIAVFSVRDLRSSPTRFTVETQVVNGASEKRRDHFFAARRCAHLALDSLGVAHQGVGALPSRAPIWPTEVLGAITHTAGFAACVVAQADLRTRGIGIDAEQIGRVDAGVAKRVMSATERTAVAGRADPEAAATAVFSAKEAFYKAQWPITEAWVGFEDIEVSFEGEYLELRPATELKALQDFTWPVVVKYLVENDVAIAGCLLT